MTGNSQSGLATRAAAPLPPTLRVPQDARTLGRVAVLMGGLSAEREVSVMSGSGVLAALRARGVDAHAFDPGREPVANLVAMNPQRAFIALHGRLGEDGTIQGLLEVLGIPYTGSGVMASAVAMDKIRTKQIWAAQGLPTPGHLHIDADTSVAELVARVPAELGLPCIIKPAREGSTLGLTRVTDPAQIAAACTLALAGDSHALAESFVDGRELTVAVVGAGATATALPVIEIRAPGGNYDYEHKYLSDATEYLCPAPLPDDLGSAVRQLAVEAYRAVGCEGWGRVDIMLARRDQRPWLLEVNTSPGMTGHSLVPTAARALGLSYEDLVLAIAASASLKVARAAIVPSGPGSGG